MASNYIGIEHSLIVFLLGSLEKTLKLIGVRVSGLNPVTISHASCSPFAPNVSASICNEHGQNTSVPWLLATIRTRSSGSVHPIIVPLLCLPYRNPSQIREKQG